MYELRYRNVQQFTQHRGIALKISAVDEYLIRQGLVVRLKLRSVDHLGGCLDVAGRRRSMHRRRVMCAPMASVHIALRPERRRDEDCRTCNRGHDYLAGSWLLDTHDTRRRFMYPLLQSAPRTSPATPSRWLPVHRPSSCGGVPVEPAMHQVHRLVRGSGTGECQIGASP